MATLVYVLTEGECGEGSRAVGVFSELDGAMAAARKEGSLYHLLEWAKQNGTWRKELATWMQFDSKGWEYNKIEQWEVR